MRTNYKKLLKESIVYPRIVNDETLKVTFKRGKETLNAVVSDFRIQEPNTLIFDVSIKFNNYSDLTTDSKVQKFVGKWVYELITKALEQDQQ